MSAEIEKYIDLTRRIKALTDERRQVGTNFRPGRTEGEAFDVRVSVTSSNRIDMFRLRRYVTAEVIAMCTTSSPKRSVTVVAKLKPRKTKRKGTSHECQETPPQGTDRPSGSHGLHLCAPLRGEQPPS